MNNSVTFSSPEVAGKRAESYGFFSQFYLEYLAPHFIEMIKNGSVLDQLDAMKDSEGYSLLKKFISVAKETDNLRNELEIDFTNLFCLSTGAGSHESNYMDDNQRLGGKCTNEVKRYYEKYSADISMDSIFLADHIGMELAFMEFMCRREAEAWEAGNNEIAVKCFETQKEFLETHIYKWIDNFVSEVNEKATYDFYKAIALMTRDWLRDEREWLNNLSTGEKS